MSAPLTRVCVTKQISNLLCSGRIQHLHHHTDTALLEGKPLSMEDHAILKLHSAYLMLKRRNLDMCASRFSKPLHSHSQLVDNVWKATDRVGRKSRRTCRAPHGSAKSFCFPTMNYSCARYDMQPDTPQRVQYILRTPVKSVHSQVVVEPRYLGSDLFVVPVDGFLMLAFHLPELALYHGDWKYITRYWSRGRMNLTPPLGLKRHR